MTNLSQTVCHKIWEWIHYFFAILLFIYLVTLFYNLPISGICMSDSCKLVLPCDHFVHLWTNNKWWPKWTHSTGEWYVLIHLQFVITCRMEWEGLGELIICTVKICRYRVRDAHINIGLWSEGNFRRFSGVSSCLINRRQNHVWILVSVLAQLLMCLLLNYRRSYAWPDIPVLPVLFCLLLVVAAARNTRPTPYGRQKS